MASTFGRSGDVSRGLIKVVVGPWFRHLHGAFFDKKDCGRRLSAVLPPGAGKRCLGQFGDGGRDHLHPAVNLKGGMVGEPVHHQRAQAIAQNGAGGPNGQTAQVWVRGLEKRT